MPSIITAIIASLLSVASGTFLYGVISFVVVAGFSVGLSYLLRPGGSSSTSGEDTRSRTTSVREAVSPWRVVYGHVRVPGSLTLIHSTDDKEFLYMVFSITGHEVEGITDLYLNDEHVPLDGNGNATGKYAGFLKAVFGGGSTGSDGLFNAFLNGEIPSQWTTAHLQEGRAKAGIRLKSNRDLFPSGVPNFTFLVRGKKVFDTRDSVTRYSANPVLCIRDYMINSDFGMNEDDVRMPDAQITAEANLCEEVVDLLFVLDTFTADASTDELTLIGTILNTRLQTGDRVQFLTTGTLPAGLSVLTNYYLIIENPIISTSRIKVASSVVNATRLVAIDITNSGSGVQTMKKDGELRYSMNGFFNVNRTPQDILQELLSAMAGTISYSAGLWRIFAGAYRTPIHTIVDKDLIGPLNIVSRVTRGEIFNSIRGTMVSAQDNFQLVGFPQRKNATYITEDGGEVLWRDVSYLWTTSMVTAQRLAKIELSMVRQQISITVTTSLKFLKVTAGDTVKITNSRMGWTDKVFFVERWTLVAGEGSEGAPQLGVEMLLKETASSLWNWQSGEEVTQDPAPDTNFPSTSEVLSPVNLILLSGTAELFISTDGTVISAIRASWTEPDDFFIDAYQIQYKKSSDSVYQNAATATELSSALISPVEDGIEYDVRVRSINVFGAKSLFESVLGHVVVGKTANPTDVDSFNIALQPDGTRVYSWVHTTPDADVKAGGGYLIRHLLGATSDWGAMTSLNIGPLTDSPYESNQLAAGTYTLAIKAVDSTGNESTNAVFISSVVLGNPRISNALIQQSERALNWPGVLVDCFVPYDNTLAALSDQVINDLPALIDSLPNLIDEMLDNKSPITYTTLEFDLGDDLNFLPIVSIPGFNGAVTTTMQTGLDSDGAAVGAFKELELILGRYLKIKVLIAGTDPRCNDITLIVDAPATVELFDDVNIATNTEPWFQKDGPGHFRITTRGGLSRITQASITAIQNVGAGFTWELLGKDVGHGAPLNSNPTFDTDIVGWTDRSSGTGSAAFLAGGFARLAGGSSGIGAISQSFTTVIGQRYLVLILLATNGGDVRVDGAVYADAEYLPLTTIGATISLFSLIARTTTIHIYVGNPNDNNSDVDVYGVLLGDPTAEFKVYNSSGVLTDAVVDIQLRGARV